MIGEFTQLPDEGMHTLLEPPSPAYTSNTIRRAYIVWQHTGQKNQFRQVCNYFHHLESMEQRLTVAQRATSRMHEFRLHTSYPPISIFLISYFPTLYELNKYNKVDMKEVHEVIVEDNVFKLEGYHDMRIRKGTTAKDVIRASQMIREYCKTHSKPLRVFLEEFQDCAKKIKAANYVDNITIYIRKKYLKDELETWMNMPKTFSFLELDDEEEKYHRATPTNFYDTKGPILAKNHTTHVKNKNNKKVKKTLFNGSRRREHFNLVADTSSKDVAENLKDKNHYEKPVFHDNSNKMNKNR